MTSHERYEQTVEVRLILEIAQSVRDEFGVTIDAHPGGKGSEAGVVNRAFRAAASRLLMTIVPAGEDMEGVETWAFRHAALRRLGVAGIAEEQARSLLNSEPRLGDLWLAYLSLAPISVIEDLLHDTHEGG